MAQDPKVESTGSTGCIFWGLYCLYSLFWDMLSILLGILELQEVPTLRQSFAPSVLEPAAAGAQAVAKLALPKAQALGGATRILLQVKRAKPPKPT